MKKNRIRLLSLVVCACLTLTLSQTVALAVQMPTIHTTLSLSGTSSVSCGQQYQESATLTDSSTHVALSNKTIKFKVDGIDAGSALTNASGTATLTITAPSIAGPHTVYAEYEGDINTYFGSNNSKTLTVTKKSTVLSASNAFGNPGGVASLSATLTSGGSAVTGKAIAFTVNGATIGTAVTNASGIATLAYSISLANGSYPISAAFEKEEFYLGSTDSAELTVSNASATAVPESESTAPVKHTKKTITASADSGGKISPEGEVSVKYGYRKCFAITADTGYEIADVQVDGESVGAVSSYTFTNVKKEHDIHASFREKTAIAMDGDKTNRTLFALEDELTTQEPDGDLTRAALISALYRLSGETKTYTSGYSDVLSGSSYEQAAAWAAANGIDQGTADGLFAPEESVTREQLAVILWNFAKYIGLDVSIGEDTNILSYNDALSVSDGAYEALQWACGAGLLGGDDSGNLNPQEPVTRAATAAMLKTLLGSMTK